MINLNARSTENIERASIDNRSYQTVGTYLYSLAHSRRENVIARFFSERLGIERRIAEGRFERIVHTTHPTDADGKTLYHVSLVTYIDPTNHDEQFTIESLVESKVLELFKKEATDDQRNDVATFLLQFSQNAWHS